MKTMTFALIAIAGALLGLGGCASNRQAIDTIPLTSEDDVFLGQSPYGMDASVVILAKRPEAIYSGGAIILTGGRELVIARPNAWRGYTGLALTAEEAMLRVQRAGQTDAAADDLNAALRELNGRVDALKTDIRRTYIERKPAITPPPAAAVEAEKAIAGGSPKQVQQPAPAPAPAPAPVPAEAAPAPEGGK